MCCERRNKIQHEGRSERRKRAATHLRASVSSSRLPFDARNDLDDERRETVLVDFLSVGESADGQRAGFMPQSERATHPSRVSLPLTTLTEGFESPEAPNLMIIFDSVPINLRLAFHSKTSVRSSTKGLLPNLEPASFLTMRFCERGISPSFFARRVGDAPFPHESSRHLQLWKRGSECRSNDERRLRTLNAVGGFGVSKGELCSSGFDDV